MRNLIYDYLGERSGGAYVVHVLLFDIAAVFSAIAIGVSDNDDDGDVVVFVIVIVEPLMAPFFTASKLQLRGRRDGDELNANNFAP